MKGSILAIGLLALASAGCASLDFGPRNAAAQTAGVGEYFVQRMEAGRLHLKQGNPTKAIEAFRQASYNPATAAEAFNGMGVAYASMGRSDVARDLFTRAIEQDPADQRYWRNLARADEQIMLARKLPAAQSEVALAASAAPAPAQASAPTAPEPARRVQAATLRTVRARETFIKTAANGTATGSGVSIVTTAPTQTAAITIEGRRASGRYPIRVALTPARKPVAAQRGSGERKSHPIRVAVAPQ